MSQPTRTSALFQAIGRQLGRASALGRPTPAMGLVFLLAFVPALAGAAFVATFLAAPLVLLIALGESAQNAWLHRHG